MTSILDLYVRPDEQCVALAGEYRLFQRYQGHRYSVDDMLVAYVAGSELSSPRCVLDLGCGLGSVMLMLAWRFPGARFVGIEAQIEHVEMARRNVLLNGCEQRATIIHGDLRADWELVEKMGPFDLITATPPYFDPRTSTVCKDSQRAYAQWELRGGIEDYALAASKLLSQGGCFVACSAANPRGRVESAFERVGLFPNWHRDVLPRPGGIPFLSLWIASRKPEIPVRCSLLLVLREADGTRTAEHIEIREWFGIPCSLN
ncbi:MAG: methyltransferase [Polyangiaceae bacterium]|nr:methyltransferase [Polyangiaceae bacterium]